MNKNKLNNDNNVELDKKDIDITKERTAKKLPIKAIIIGLLVGVFLLFTTYKKISDGLVSFRSEPQDKTNTEQILVKKKEFNINRTTSNSNKDDYNEYNIKETREPVTKNSVFYKGMRKKDNTSTKKNNTDNDITENSNETTLSLQSGSETESETTAEVGVVKAKISKLNPSLSLSKGTIIQCSLATKLVSQISGQMICNITDDVFSDDGNVLLIEKGSKAIGVYSRDSINAGDNRIFVMWNEIRTPHNIKIAVNSSASDSLGGAGVEGMVDNHFFTKFGSALMLSLITDVTKEASQRLIQRKPKNNGEINVFGGNDSSTLDGMADVMSSIIKQNLSIPPTIYRNHGDAIAIFLNNDIDFSNVYKLEYHR